jgi:Domain of unknown function (DUF5666)
MSAKWLRGIGLIVLALAALVACGGGGGTQMAGGGIGGTGVSFGAVTQLGSIFVNGVEFDTDSATVMLNGDPGPDVGMDSHRGLKKGMVVRVNGDFDDKAGTAAKVEYEDNLEGPITLITVIDANTKQLIVLGQTVIIDDTQTQYENTSFAMIAQSDFVEVSGLPDDMGRIRATFVEKKLSPPAAVEVKGLVQNVDTMSKTFMLNALTVDYGSAALVDFSASDPANGQFVEVKGTTFNGLDQLVADSVELKLDGLAAEDSPRVEVEGFVTAFTSSSQFTVGNQPVATTANTLFVGGLQSEIALGSKLEVEGSLANGVLTATKVEFEESVKLESNATVSGSTIMLEGLPGITVTANAFTEFKGGTSATANDLTPLDGHNVQIRGRASGPTSVIATEIEDDGPAVSNADVILQGSATDAADPTFKILGVTVDTSMLASADFKDANDNPISAMTFFNALTLNGGLVKAKGRLPATTPDALAADSLKEVELEE